MRIEPRSSLTVQLIQEAQLGPGRFDPVGPRLRLTTPVRDRFEPLPAASCPDLARVDAKSDPRPADTHRCDDPPLPPQLPLIYAPAVREVHVTRVIETTVLPSHLAGALLDVLA